MHFYENTDLGVAPRHFVEMTTREGLRPTRLADWRKWKKAGRDVVPSVTTIMGVMAKPGLEYWKIDQHLNQAFEVDASDIDTFKSEVRRLTELQMDKAPQAGTDLHDSLEKAHNGDLPVTHPDYALCQYVLTELYKATGEVEWETEKRFATSLYGGAADMVSRDWVVDYKTKQTADKFKPGKMVFDEHLMQLSAYGDALDCYKAANVFVCLETGEVDIVIHDSGDLATGRQMFDACIDLWYLKNGG